MRANDALDVHVKPLLVSVKRSSAQHNNVGDSCACGGMDNDDDDGSSGDDDNWADDDDSDMEEEDNDSVWRSCNEEKGRGEVAENDRYIA